MLRERGWMISLFCHTHRPRERVEKLSNNFLKQSAHKHFIMKEGKCDEKYWLNDSRCQVFHFSTFTFFSIFHSFLCALIMYMRIKKKRLIYHLKAIKIGKKDDTHFLHEKIHFCCMWWNLMWELLLIPPTGVEFLIPKIRRNK